MVITNFPGIKRGPCLKVFWQKVTKEVFKRALHAILSV
ncbi:cysteine-rich protein 2-binding, partial [Moniliophthora roreri]